MTKKKVFRLIALALFVALVISLTACDPNAGYVDPELPDEYEISPQGRIKVSMYLRSGEQSEIALDNWINVYNKKYPDVTVRTDIIEWAQFPVQVAAGDIGDVYYTSDLDVYKYAVKSRAALYLDSYIDLLDIDITQVYQGIYELGCYNGKLYMVPSDISQSTFLVNVSALREVGLEKPTNDWTYDDFLYYCSKLKAENSDGTYSRVGIYIQTDDEVPALTYWLEGWGGQWVDVVNKKTHFVSDEKVLQGMDALMDLYTKGYATSNGLVGEIGAKHANLSDPQGYGFKYGLHCGILWQDRIANFELYDALGLEMDVVTVPETPTRVIPGDTFGYLVYSKTKNPDAAATFALTLLTYEGQVAFNSVLGGGIPCTKQALASDVWRIPFEEDEFNYDAFIAYPEAFVACWLDCSVPPEIASIIESYLPTLVSKHVNGIVDYKDTLEKIERECNEKWETLLD